MSAVAPEKPTSTQAAVPMPLYTAHRLKWALYYASLGIHVFPTHVPIFDANDKCIGCTCEHYRRSDECKEKHPRLYLGPKGKCDGPGKCPAVRWTERATIDLTQIRKWWNHTWPTVNVETNAAYNFIPNIGVNCGKSGILVFDADTYKAAAGELEDVTTYNERDTVRVLSGGGGEHFWYGNPRAYGNSSGDLPDWVDIKGVGGYVIVPPSLHKSNNRYTFVEGHTPDDYLHS